MMGATFLHQAQRTSIGCQTSMRIWESLKSSALQDFWPKEEIPYGWQTHDWMHCPDHGYTHWYRMFNPRQLLILATILLKKIMMTGSVSMPVKEQALGAFQQYLRNNSCFAFGISHETVWRRYFSNNNFVPKQLVIENCVFPVLGSGNWTSCSEKVIEALEWCHNPWEPVLDIRIRRRVKARATVDPAILKRIDLLPSSSDIPELDSESQILLSQILHSATTLSIPKWRTSFMLGFAFHSPGGMSNSEVLKIRRMLKRPSRTSLITRRMATSFTRT